MNGLQRQWRRTDKPVKHVHTSNYVNMLVYICHQIDYLHHPFPHPIPSSTPKLPNPSPQNTPFPLSKSSKKRNQQNNTCANIIDAHIAIMVASSNRGAIVWEGDWRCCFILLWPQHTQGNAQLSWPHLKFNTVIHSIPSDPTSIVNTCSHLYLNQSWPYTSLNCVILLQF